MFSPCCVQYLIATEDIGHRPCYKDLGRGQRAQTRRCAQDTSVAFMETTNPAAHSVRHCPNTDALHGAIDPIIDERKWVLLKEIQDESEPVFDLGPFFRVPGIVKNVILRVPTLMG